MNIDADVKEIREQVKEIAKNPDILLQERETIGIMTLSERALSPFLDEDLISAAFRTLRQLKNFFVQLFSSRFPARTSPQPNCSLR